MKAVILAAGYATRLYPLTLNRPKALLPMGETTILDHIIDQLEMVEEIKEIIIVSNHKFIGAFQNWQQTRKISKFLKIIDDGTNCDEEKLGAIGDLNLVVEEEKIQEDLLVLAGDNIFTFSLKDYVGYFKKKSKDCIVVQFIDKQEELHRVGNVLVDSSNKVIYFKEKPRIPRSNLGVFALYIYRQNTLPLFKQYLAEGNKPDAPGYFLEWLYLRKEVYAYFPSGQCFDIGTPQAYQEVQQFFMLKK